MNIQNFTSKLLESAVDEFSKLPGIGQKTALRLVLHLLKQNVEQVADFGNAIIQLRNNIKYCKVCNNDNIVFIDIAYSAKLLFQELMATNVHPRFMLSRK